MIDFFQHLFALDFPWFFDQYGTAIYFLLFLIIFVETGLVAMPFLPGDSLLFTAGLFCKSGQLEILVLLPLLFTAAVLGDNVNYWVGRRLGLSVFQWKFRGKPMVKEEYLVRTEQFFIKYGSFAVVMGRFIPFVRTFTPFAAGVAKMDYRKFVMIDVVGGALWIGSMMMAGYLLGEIPWIREHVDLIAIGIVAISVAPLLISLMRRKK
jgi:membrane-associated protein